MSDPRLLVASNLHGLQQQAMAEDDFSFAIGVELAAERYSETIPEDVAIEFLSAYYHGVKS